MSQNVTGLSQPVPLDDLEIALASIVDGGSGPRPPAPRSSRLCIHEHAEDVGDSLAAVAGGAEGDAGGSNILSPDYICNVTCFRDLASGCDNQ